jgi:hypothetical protein
MRYTSVYICIWQITIRNSTTCHFPKLLLCYRPVDHIRDDLSKITIAEHVPMMDKFTLLFQGRTFPVAKRLPPLLLLLLFLDDSSSLIRPKATRSSCYLLLLGDREAADECVLFPS